MLARFHRRSSTPARFLSIVSEQEKSANYFNKRTMPERHAMSPELRRVSPIVAMGKNILPGLP
ncbi:MAG: hypothetical protein C0508_17870 [Cyanobacteria bacterium PR.023]|nr:hypothetical protein [Cyanobacteria bacterium DS2.008]MBA4076913.1 hypothetical protein [Cyanobacteria bacterium PR.023]